MKKNIMLFPEVSKPRRKSRKLMHVVDAGTDQICHCDENSMVIFKCKHCGYESDWMSVRTSAAFRGIPCPKCNLSERSLAK